MTSQFSWLLVAVSLISLSAIGSAADYPGKSWPTASSADVGMDESRLKQARDYALTGSGSGCIIRHGKLVMSWGSQAATYDLKSTTKSIGVTALGLAIADGKMKLTDQAAKHHPSLGTPPRSNDATGWLKEITILHLATQTAGFDKPGGYTKLLFRPGSKWHYSDGGPNWLAECVTLQYKRDLKDVMFERVFTPLGITSRDLNWRNNSYRKRTIAGVARREFGSGIRANVNAMARIGYLYLHAGKWNDKQILPRSFVETASRPHPDMIGIPEQDSKRFNNASDHYGLLWWNNADGSLKGVPRDAYWSWGLYDSLIVVIPSLDIVVARAGRSWKRTSKEHYAVLKPFLEPIAGSVQGAKKSQAPYPPSRVITRLTWAPKASIIRKAPGGDNWPMTWADDGHLYTAYGDGWGFAPKVKKKLSLGLARVEGGPGNFKGINIRSADAEQTGGGSSGKKASGMLMVDGVLYMWVRNAGNAQLAWSRNHGQSWQWANWKWTTSFGCPTFLNFGKNYAGARDSYVYVYSQDRDSAYQPADRMVLARVPKSKLNERDAYEFFQDSDGKSRPVWTREIKTRGAVFNHPGRCYRFGISYNAPLKRYLWCQIIPGGDTRFKGGLAIYDAPEPWGPWTTVFFTKKWDVGPGESASIPTKWIGADGKTFHMVFSGNDAFSVRKATVETASRGGEE